MRRVARVASLVKRPPAMIARPIQARLLAFSTTDVGSPTSLSKDEAIAVLKSVLSFLNLGVPGKKLEEIGRGSSNVQTKWQSMMEVRLQTELHVVNAFGFESSQMGMMAYRQTMAHLMQRSSPEDLAEIQALDGKIWTSIMKRTFGVSPEPIELDQARQIVYMVTSSLQQAEFLSKLGKEVEALGAEPSDLAKNEVLQTSLLGAWQDCLSKFGYDGDDGYVKFQAALVEHSSDHEIAMLIQSALMAVTRGAGLQR